MRLKSDDGGKYILTQLDMHPFVALQPEHTFRIDSFGDGVNLGHEIMDMAESWNTYELNGLPSGNEFHITVYAGSAPTIGVAGNIHLSKIPAPGTIALLGFGLAGLGLGINVSRRLENDGSEPAGAPKQAVTAAYDGGPQAPAV